MLSIETFQSMYSKASTKEAYGISLTQYFDFLKTTAEEYKPDKNQVRIDIANFAQHLRGKNLAPKSVTLKVKAILSYLNFNEVVINKFAIKQLSLDDEAETDDRIPTQKELQSIFTHLDVKGKAIYFTMLSTGLRIGDVMRLNVNDVCNGGIKNQLKVKQKKNGKKVLVFLTNECKSAIEEWLKVRGEWLKKTVKACQQRNINKSEDDNRLFPLTKVNAHKMWTNALKKAGLEEIDNNTGIRTIRPHSLRKYFRTACATAGLQQDISECLIGHSNGLNRVYVTNHLSEENLRRAFEKVEPSLSVYKTIIKEAGTDQLKEQVEIMQERIKELEKILKHRPLFSSTL